MVVADAARARGRRDGGPVAGRDARAVAARRARRRLRRGDRLLRRRRSTRSCRRSSKRRRWPGRTPSTSSSAPATLRLAGPALGGVLVGRRRSARRVPRRRGYVRRLDVCVLLMTRRPPAEARRRRHRSIGDIREGFGYVRSKVWLWATFLAATIAYLLFIGPVEVLVPYVVKNEMHEGAKVLGVVLRDGRPGGRRRRAVRRTPTGCPAGTSPRCTSRGRSRRSPSRATGWRR